MRLPGLVFLLVPALAPAQSTLSIVSSASYAPTVAPDSLATIFGTRLSTSTAAATLDANGQLPVELASTHVEVNGAAASLIYVSPGQINFVMPPGIAAGSTAVAVRSTASLPTQSANVTVANTAPALFTSDASGAGACAILNAVTFQPAPFLVETTGDAADLRTRLAAYGTGLRHASSVTASAVDTNGNRFPLAVEYAGAAPGFFGLDQLNVVLPADLDGAGNVSLILSTADGTSNTVTFQMNLLPVSSLHLASLALSPQFVTGGDPITATVALNGVARTSGFAVGLRSSNLAAQIAPVVTVPEGKATAATTVSTSAVSSVQNATISAQAGTVTLTSGFEIDPPSQSQVASLSLNPPSVLGGRNVTGTVTLTSTVAAGNVTVQLSSDNASARPPATVTVPFNQSSAGFAIATATVSTSQAANLTASLSRSTATAQLQILTALALSLDQTSVTGGSTVNGTVSLGEPAPAGGAAIILASSDAASARPPNVLTIPVGQLTGTFAIPTSTVAAARTVNISAVYGGQSQSVALTVNPQGAPALSAVSVSPDHVSGGATASGMVTLTNPAGSGGMIVNLASSSLAAATIPGFVIVPQGAASAVFTINTNRVATPQNVVITASAAGVSKTTILTVQ